jgi:hypothetical protein
MLQRHRQMIVDHMTELLHYTRDPELSKTLQTALQDVADPETLKTRSEVRSVHEEQR